MEIRRSVLSKFDTPMSTATAPVSNDAYQLLFKVRFDLPFPFYEDEYPRRMEDRVGPNLAKNGHCDSGLVENMLPVRDTILNKVSGLKRDLTETKKNTTDQSGIATKQPPAMDRIDNNSNKSFRRRAAVFDHHDVHPDWADKLDDNVQSMNPDFPGAPPTFVEVSKDDPVLVKSPKSRPIQYCHSMRLPETRNRAAVVSDDHALDRMKSASVKIDKVASFSKIKEGGGHTQSAGPATPGSPRVGGADAVAMSEVNKMRTDRLANALKALEKKTTPSESSGCVRTQSMRNTRGRRQQALEGHIDSEKANCDADFESRGRTETERWSEFRRRTSSVPPRCEETKKNRKNRPSGGDADDRSNSPIQKRDDSRSSPVDDSAYQRMRTFTIDPAKGAVVNRGDSFRRRCNTGTAQRTSEMVCGHSPGGAISRNSSNLSSRSHSPMPLNPSSYLSPPEPLSPCQCANGVRTYHVVVLGLDGVGKTSMINQFMTSEYCFPFQNDAGINRGSSEISVTVILNGEESKLNFIEADNQKNDLSLTLSGAGYLVVYSIDDAMSFENAKQVLFQLRLQTHSADKPIVLVGNKMDLERKRIVSTEEGKQAAKDNDCKFVEIAVALGHHVDELLVAILAQIRHDDKVRPVQTDVQCASRKSVDEQQIDRTSPVADFRNPSSGGSSSRSSSGSVSPRQIRPGGVIRRSSTRRGKPLSKQVGADSNAGTTSCSNLTAVGHRLAGKVFGRRRGSRSLEDLLSVRK